MSHKAMDAVGRQAGRLGSAASIRARCPVVASGLLYEMQWSAVPIQAWA
jgi:hypothetical protein